MSFVRGPERFRFYRLIDVLASAVGGAVLLPALVCTALVSKLLTRGPTLYRQTRVGRHGDLFTVVKFRTMITAHPDEIGQMSTVTVKNDDRVTPFGRLLRSTKVDELPQLANVLRGEMSLVGPRPDVPGYLDRLEGDDAIVASVRPGVTGPATVILRGEESMLGAVEDPLQANDEIVWPMKVRINAAWIRHGSLVDDLQILLNTFLPTGPQRMLQSVRRWDSGLAEDVEAVALLDEVHYG